MYTLYIYGYVIFSFTTISHSLASALSVSLFFTHSFLTAFSPSLNLFLMPLQQHSREQQWALENCHIRINVAAVFLLFRTTVFELSKLDILLSMESQIF